MRETQKILLMGLQDGSIVELDESRSLNPTHNTVNNVVGSMLYTTFNAPVFHETI